MGAVYELMIWLGVIITPVKLVDAVVKTGVDSARHFVDWFSGRQPTIDELQVSQRAASSDRRHVQTSHGRQRCDPELHLSPRSHGLCWPGKAVGEAAEVGG